MDFFFRRVDLRDESAEKVSGNSWAGSLSGRLFDSARRRPKKKTKGAPREGFLGFLLFRLRLRLRLRLFAVCFPAPSPPPVTAFASGVRRKGQGPDRRKGRSGRRRLRARAGAIFGGFLSLEVIFPRRFPEGERERRLSPRRKKPHAKAPIKSSGTTNGFLSPLSPPRAKTPGAFLPSGRGEHREGGPRSFRVCLIKKRWR